jgi:hypothetical protein
MALATLLGLGCGEGSGSMALAPPASEPSDAASSRSDAAPDGGSLEAGSVADASQAFEWRTGTFDLAPGQERYLCFAKTLDEDMTVGAYSNEGQPFVHHVIFARTRSPEPDGFSECNTGFRNSWDPLYIAGAGPSKLEMPSDAGHILTKGTQLLAQLHLLNLGTQPVTATAAIDMYRTSVVNPRPVNSYIFGTMNVNLPPMQTSEVVGQCSVREPLKLIAAFPHMHMLGRAMRFEVGASADTMATVFQRDPFDFDNQHIDRIALDLAQGNQTRLTCKYDNPHPTAVTYGESTLNEMCYLIAFAVDRTSISACIQ